MRLLPLAIGVACLGAGAAAIEFGGARLMADAGASVAATVVGVENQKAVVSPPPALRPVAPVVAEPGLTIAQTEPTPVVPPSTATRPREVTPGAPLSAPAAPLERVEPRAPLSDVYAPPSRKSEAKPVEGQEDWRVTRLFNPVASAAGRLEVKGHKIALTGIEPVPLDEKCNWNGTEWPCGAVARTAFRQWLRSRAVQCKVPDVALAQEIRADCYIGRSDMSDWLISNGWARPETGGPYTEAGDKAKTAGAGIYGAPPRRISVILTPRMPVIEPGDTTLLDADPLESTPDELSQEPEVGLAPPATLDPQGPFPPPPPAQPTP